MNSKRKKKLGKILFDEGKITEAQLNLSVEESRKRIGYFLCEEKGKVGNPFITPEDIAHALRIQYPSWKVKSLGKINGDILKLSLRCYYPKWKEWEIIPISVSDRDRKVTIASVDPISPKDERYNDIYKWVNSIIASFYSYEPEFVLAPQAIIWDYIKRLEREESRAFMLCYYK